MHNPPSNKKHSCHPLGMQASCCLDCFLLSMGDSSFREPENTEIMIKSWKTLAIAFVVPSLCNGKAQDLQA